MTSPMLPSRPPSGQSVPVTDITQQQTTQVGPDGRPALGYSISFKTPSGTVGSVFVPMSQYTVANVQAAITAHAAEIEAVHKLAT